MNASEPNCLTEIYHSKMKILVVSIINVEMAFHNSLHLKHIIYWSIFISTIKKLHSYVCVVSCQLKRNEIHFSQFLKLNVAQQTSYYDKVLRVFFLSKT